ncbi:Protein of unknown function DUF1876, partial [Klenkia terrae]
VDATTTWTTRITIGEHDGRTRAVAHLRTRDLDELVGVGFTRLSPADPDVPRIGDEIAVARALVDLGHRLLHVAAEDLEEVTGRPAHLVV